LAILASAPRIVARPVSGPKRIIDCSLDIDHHECGVGREDHVAAPGSIEGVLVEEIEKVDEDTHSD